MGLEIPNVEVRFENLHITADVNIGSRALPTLVNFSRDMLEVNLFNFLNFNFFFNSYYCNGCSGVLCMQYVLIKLRIFRPKRHALTILNDVSGVVKPGR